MIRELILKSIFINDKKADGTPYVDKNGNPFKMAVIQDETGNKASMFCGKFQFKDLQVIQGWQSGMKVRVNLEQDGKFINFSLPSKTDELLERLEKLEKVVYGSRTVNSATQPHNAPQNANSGQIQGITPPPAGTTREEYPVGEEMIDVDSIPF